MNEEQTATEIDDESDLTDLPEVDADAQLLVDLNDDDDDDDDDFGLSSEQEAEPEATPEEAEVETEVSEDEGDPTAPYTNDRKGIHELREAYKRQAREAKENKQRLAELEIERNELIRRQQEGGQPAEANSVPKEVFDIAQKFSTEEILDFLGRYEAGLVEGDSAKMDALKADAKEALELKSPAEVHAVLVKARRGGYGEVSRDIELIAGETLAVLNTVGETRKQALAQQESVQKRRLTAVENIRRVLPPTAFDATGKINPATAEGKEYLDAGNELVQAIPNLLQIPEAPELVHRFLQMKKAEAQLSLVEKENKELKARLQRFTRSMPPGRTESPSAKGKPARSPDDVLREQMAALGFE